MIYGAYGSNLNMKQMAYRCPKARPAGSVILDGYRLVFRGSKTGSYLTIEPAAGYKVPIGLWEITKSCEKSLDRYEGYPVFYEKQLFQINNKSILIYVMNPGRKIGIPTRRYVETCIEGYHDFGFDQGILIQSVKEAVDECNKN